MPLSGEYAPSTAAWWERAVETWPDYARYQARTSREIPVCVLEPVPEDPAG
jgi:F420H(2)-dependent quinone reductase